MRELEIGHPNYLCLVEPESAFWALVRRDKLSETLANGKLAKSYSKKAESFRKEMEMLRFSAQPSAVYFNPTERCNLNCSYCYIPEEMRSNGRHMSEENIFKALSVLKEYFSRTLPKGRVPEIIFHGAEPLLNRKAIFSAIEKYKNDFRFGIQTNSTLLDSSAVEFLTSSGVSIGLSLDAPIAAVSDRTRKNWSGEGVYEKVVEAMERLKGTAHWSVICTISSENMRYLTELVCFFHQRGVPTCMLNVVRCTLPPSRKIKPDDQIASKHFISALDKSYELYQQTGRKLTIANFANILLAIIAPTARRLMCDISPCGGGRSFFALAPNGDLFPCSEFIGLDSFKGGNIFSEEIGDILASEPFSLVTQRKVENINSCRTCAIRHFCGSPCPAEAFEMNGGMEQRGAFCKFYKEQVNYAFRVIADGREDSYLWDRWDEETKITHLL